MITYKDRAWCSASVFHDEKRCVNYDCPRNYSEAEEAKNEAGVNLPLSITDFSSDTCGYVPAEK